VSARAELNTLEATGLIEIAALEPELEYLFRHALVQEAAYSSLLKQDRRGLHRAAAETILALHPGRESELAAVVAIHFEQAGDGPRAAEYLVLAGDHAVQRFANQEAISFFTRASTMAADNQAELRLRAAIGLARAGWAFAPSETIVARLDAALEHGDLADRGLRTEGYFWLAFMLRMRGETPDSNPALARALAHAAERGLAEQDSTAVPRALMGAFAAFSGQLREGARDMSEALDVIEERGDPISAAMVANFLAGAYSRLGDFAAAERTIERNTRYAERGDDIAIIDRDIALAGLNLERGDADQARAASQQCSIRAESAGAFACVVASNAISGAACLARNDPAAAKIPLDRGSELCRVINFAPLRTLIYALLGTTRAQLGDMPGGVAGWDQALANARAINDRYGEAQTLGGRGRSRARAEPNELPAALSDLDRAIELFESMEARPALARALHDRADVLRQLGRSDASSDDDRRSRDIARELGLTDLAVS
jgi:tetratricopeptide (TPR) repeat protein